jgi:hypothetical protein
MSRRYFGVVALATFAASTSAVLAAETDTFRGHTEGKFFTDDGYRRARISFERTGNNVRHVRFEIRVRCPSGQHRSRVVRLDEPTRVRNGRFERERIAVGFDVPFRSDEFIRGRIRGDHASGIVSLETTLNSKGEEAAGGRQCKSGEVEWEAAAP